jgi:hypothetical protein
MFGVDWSNPETLWLNLTNLGLGIVTLVCVVAVAYNIAVEYWQKARAAASERTHAMHVPELGWTMADGGEPVEPEKPKKGR